MIGHWEEFVPLYLRNAKICWKKEENIWNSCFNLTSVLLKCISFSINQIHIILTVNEIVLSCNFFYTLAGPLFWWAEFTNGPGDQSSTPGRVIPMTQKMVLHTSLLNTQHNMVRIKDKVEQSKEKSSTLSDSLV